jgi:hypothetical protein
VAVQTDVLSRADVALQTEVTDAATTVPTAEVVEAPPLPAAAALIWFNFASSRSMMFSRGVNISDQRFGF